MPESMQQQISDLMHGKHKQWHLEAVKTREYGELGWEYLTQTSWEFIAGFDSEKEAREALERAEDYVREGRPYGADDYDFRLSEEVGGHRRWRH